MRSRERIGESKGWKNSSALRINSSFLKKATLKSIEGIIQRHEQMLNGISARRRIYLGIAKVEDGAVVLEHVNFFDSGDRVD